MKRLLSLVALFATLQASAQQVNPVPDYVFANRMSAGRNTVTDTAAYFSIGPRYGATRGMMPPMVVDTASFSANKRNGLLIFSVQKNKFLYWDSVGVKWAEMAGTGGSAITGSGVAGYMPEFTTTTNLDTTRLYHSAGRFAIGSTTTTNGVFNVYGGQTYFDTSIKVGSSTFLADEGKNETYIAMSADSGAFPLQVNGSVFSNMSLYLSGVRRWELTAGETSSFEIINRNSNVRIAIFDTNRNAAFGAVSSAMGADAALYVNGNAKEVYVNSTTDAGSYALQVSGNLYNTQSAFLAASIGEVYIGSTTDAGSYALQVTGNLYNTQGAVLAASGGNVGIGGATSAWSLGKVLQVGAIGSSNPAINFPTTGGIINIVNGYFDGGGYRYQNNGTIASIEYNVSQGSSWAFRTAATGTAGNSATLTTRMILTNEGEMNIATTTDAGDYKLQVAGNIYNTGSVTTGAPSGGSVKPWKIGEAATVSPTSPNRTIRVEIDGVVYYIHAKTTND
jgi:hypothetical protein